MAGAYEPDYVLTSPGQYATWSESLSRMSTAYRRISEIPSKGSIRDKQGQPLAYFRRASPSQLFAASLSGPPVGPEVGRSSLSPSGNFANATWPEAEKRRWKAYRH